MRWLAVYALLMGAGVVVASGVAVDGTREALCGDVGDSEDEGTDSPIELPPWVCCRG